MRSPAAVLAGPGVAVLWPNQEQPLVVSASAMAQRRTGAFMFKTVKFMAEILQFHRTKQAPTN
jgi:hypothetical protein